MVGLSAGSSRSLLRYNFRTKPRKSLQLDFAVLQMSRFARRVVGTSMLCAVGLLLTSGSSVAASETLSHPVSKWYGWWELGRVSGSRQSGRGETTLFAPISQTETSLFFLDAKGKLFEDDIKEGNFALGYRQMMDNGVNLGGWLGTDVRQSSFGNTFWQASGGVEALSHDYDFRSNFYVPLSKTARGVNALTAGVTTVNLTANNIFMQTSGRTRQQSLETPLWGVDVEAGFRIPLEDVNPTFSHAELRAYGGGYYFDGNNIPDNIAGDKVRLELRFPDVFEALPGSQFTAGYEFSYDDVRKDRHQVGLKLRIPIGQDSSPHTENESSYSLAAMNAQERRMLDGLVRDTDIVTSEYIEEVALNTITESVIDDATDVALVRVAYAHDFATLQAAATQGANTLIIVEKGLADIDVSATSGTTLQSRQTVQGGGSTINLRGAQTGTIAAFTAPGSRPTLSSTSGAAIILPQAATEVHIAGLNIVTTPGSRSMTSTGGVALSDATNIFVQQNSFRGLSSQGLFFGNNNDRISIVQNEFQSIWSAVQFGDNNSRIRISDNVFDGAGVVQSGTMLLFENYTDDLTIDSNVFRNIWGGIFSRSWASDVRITNNRFEDMYGDAIRFADNNPSGTSFGVPVLMGASLSRAVISGNSFTNVGATGSSRGAIWVEDAALDVFVTGNTLQSIGGEGIQFDDDHRNVTISGNTLIDIGEEGIRFDNYNAGITIVGNFLVNTGDDAIRFDNGNDGVTIEQNNINGSASHGLHLGDSGARAGQHFSNTNFTVSANTISNIMLDAVRVDEGMTGFSATGNVFSGVTGTVFGFSDISSLATGFQITDGRGNSVTDASAPLCTTIGAAPAFNGILEITDRNGGLQIFTNGAGC